MDKKSALRSMWEQLKPLREDIARTYPNHSKAVAVQFRGFNRNSVNSPGRGIMELWVNSEDLKNISRDAPELLTRHWALLKAVWTQMLQEISPHVDRVLIAIEGGPVYVPGIYPAHTDINQELPSYQLSIDG
jgi:hypothetical protein